MRIIEDAQQSCFEPAVLSPSRVSRVVHRYHKFGTGTLIDFLGEHLRLSDDMKYRIVKTRGWERWLMHSDPTGEQAVANVMKEQRTNG